MRHHVRTLGVLSAIVCGLVVVASPQANAAASHAQITGSGSGWSANAVNQWVADVDSSG
ncbi:MAG: phosphate ABC transporter substrate-binding protein, partial [Actinobacteria bacterium]|nr:phosphate ABC transporter substrate-binding protein [Actinomycetota bacterium]